MPKVKMFNPKEIHSELINQIAFEKILLTRIVTEKRVSDFAWRGFFCLFINLLDKAQQFI